MIPRVPFAHRRRCASGDPWPITCLCIPPEELRFDGSPVGTQHAQMSRRSTQQQTIDDAACPVPVLVIFTKTGSGQLLA